MTFTESPSGHTYVASADNTTDKKIAGIVIPAFGVKCSGLLSAAKATTAGSNIVGAYLNILTTDSRKLNEASATATPEQFLIMPGRSASDPTDPADPTTTRIIVTAYETEPGVATAA